MDTKPLLSDQRIRDIETGNFASERMYEMNYRQGMQDARDFYEADRQKTWKVVQANRKLIQSWVDALGDALKSFESAGYTPTAKP